MSQSQRGVQSNALRGLIAITTVLAVVLGAFALPSLVSARGEWQPSPGIDVAELPDIYYLIPDRYPREDTLTALFDYDNSAWIAALEARGFQVADEALGNYPSTGMSLASTWNLDMIDALVPDKPGNPQNWAPPYALLKDHALGRNLVLAGYEYTHMGTWWEPTSIVSTATQNLRLEDPEAFPDHDWGKGPRNTLFQWQELQRMAADQYEPRDQPRFVLAHITVPHEPYRFDADGSYVPPDLAKSRTREDNFRRQLQYVNNQIDTFLDELLSGPREDWPMVVIQSDEGPHPVGKKDNEYNWLEVDPINWHEKLQIFSAILMPANSDLVLPEDLRSVNTWRLLIDDLLGTDLGPIDAPVYIYSPKAIYDVVDVTDELARGLATP